MRTSLIPGLLQTAARNRSRGLTDLALPELELIGSAEQTREALPLLFDTACQLAVKGPVFRDGETVGYEAGPSGRLEVLWSTSLMDPKRQVLALRPPRAKG